MRSPDIRDTIERAPQQVPEQRPNRQTYRDRTNLYQLNGDELRAMKIVGAFRAVDPRDLPQVGLQRLMANGLVKSRTVYPGRGGERREVVFLTPQGRELLKCQQAHGDPQRYYAGLVKPNEIEHDVAIYAAFRDEAAAIEKAGGKVRRVVLDYEFKSSINREMNRREGPPPEDRRKQLAEDWELPIMDERLALPDLRIEYIDADGREGHRDIEVVTRHYRGSHRASKARSGFRLVNANGPRASVNDDHHLGWL